MGKKIKIRKFYLVRVRHYQKDNKRFKSYAVVYK